MTYLGIIAGLQSAEFIKAMEVQSTIKYSTPDAENNMIISVGGKFFRYIADPTNADPDENGNYPKQLTEITDLSEAMELNLLKAMASGASTESAEAIISKVAGLQ